MGGHRPRRWGAGGMKIASARTHIADTGGGRTWCFVELTAEDGRTGWGEASQSRNDPAAAYEVERLSPLYHGQHPLDLIQRRQALAGWAYEGKSLACAISALEMACWDLAGQDCGQPVFRLLGGAAQDSVRLYANISLAAGGASAEAQAAAAHAAVAAGFGAVKLNFGFRPRHPSGSRAIDFWIAEGVARVAAVREAVGAEVDVLVDLVHQFSEPREALSVARALEPYRPFWLEDPFTWDDPKLCAAFRKECGTRVAGAAALLHRRDFRALLEAEALDVIMPDLKWCGGILEARKLAAQAELYGVTVSPHNFSGPVGCAASAQLAMTLPNFLILEYCFAKPDWRGALCGGGERVEAGAIPRPEAPGLGLSLDRAVLAQHPVMGLTQDIRAVPL